MHMFITEAQGRELLANRSNSTTGNGKRKYNRTGKQIKAQVFAAIRTAHGIAKSQKFKMYVENPDNPDYLKIRDRRTGEPLDNGIAAPAPAPVVVKTAPVKKAAAKAPAAKKAAVKAPAVKKPAAKKVAPVKKAAAKAAAPAKTPAKAAKPASKVTTSATKPKVATVKAKPVAAKAKPAAKPVPPKKVAAKPAVKAPAKKVTKAK